MANDPFDQPEQPPAKPEQSIEDLIHEWALVVTDSTMDEREQNLNAKVRTVQDFFDYVKKHPEDVKARDVVKWHEHMSKAGLSAGSIYARVSRVSSFFNWRMKDPAFAEICRVNPVSLGRPKAPVPYANADPLSDKELNALISVIQHKADLGDVVGYRDYALLLFYLMTGMSRADILRLKWGDISFTDESMIFSLRVHSGNKRTREILDPTLREALFNYLAVTGRTETIRDEDPVWIRHDPASLALDEQLKPEAKPLTVQALDKAMKRYANEANIKDFHLHRLRHSYARLIGEALHSIEEVRDALGHKSTRTTIQLLNQIKIERDRLSPHLARRLGLDEDE